MKIEGKLTGEVNKVTNARNKAKDGQTASVDLVVRVDQDRCRKIFGDLFTDKVAFSGMAERTKKDGVTEYVHYNAPKATDKIVMEMHDIKLWGRKLTGIQPTVTPHPVQGEAKVDLVVRLPVDVGENKDFDLQTIRSPSAREKVTVDFNPKQGGLSLAPRGEKKKADG